MSEKSNIANQVVAFKRHPGEEVYGLFMAEHNGRCMLAATSHGGTNRVQS